MTDTPTPAEATAKTVQVTSAGPPTALVPQRPLLTYRVRVKVAVGDILDYFVRTPTQCSATKHTAFLPEVEEILLVVLVHENVPEGQIKFSTEEDCG